MSEGLHVFLEPPVRILRLYEKGNPGASATTGLMFFKSGKPTAGELINVPLVIGDIPLTEESSFVRLRVAPTSPWEMRVLLDGDLVASATVAAGENVGPFTFEPGFEGFGHLDAPEFYAPLIQDASAADLSVSMQSPLET